MPNSAPTREDAVLAMRRLLREADLPAPDEIHDHEDGGIVCLWHEPSGRWSSISSPSPTG